VVINRAWRFQRLDCALNLRGPTKKGSLRESGKIPKYVAYLHARLREVMQKSGIGLRDTPSGWLAWGWGEGEKKDTGPGTFNGGQVHR